MNIRWERGNTVPAVAYYSLKALRGLPGLTFPFDWQITINSTYVFSSYALVKDLGFNPGTFGTETSDWVSVPPSLLVPRRNLFIKNSYSAWHQTQGHCVQGSDSTTAPECQWSISKVGDVVSTVLKKNLAYLTFFYFVSLIL